MLSFRSCGVCLADDGSEDETIHCFKEHQRVWKWWPVSTIDKNRVNPFYINVTESDVEDGAPNIAIVDSDAEDDIDVEI